MITRTNKIFFIINPIIIVFLIFCNFFLTLNQNIEKTTEDIFEENILKIVEIKVSDDNETWGYATGFFIDSKGTILTNKHVVFNTTTNGYYQNILVTTADREEFVNAEVIKISEIDDLALIKSNIKSNNYFSLQNKVDNGETIYTIGNPNGFGLSFAQGVISSNSRNVTYNGKTINTIQTSLVINEGNSGGPVFNKNGKLLGLISFRLKDQNGDVIQGCSFAIPVNIIKKFIAN